eukprot:COSAG02_NODE_42074_length_388_cov_0.761246_1_plen_106_part_01
MCYVVSTLQSFLKVARLYGCMESHRSAGVGNGHNALMPVFTFERQCRRGAMNISGGETMHTQCATNCVNQVTCTTDMSVETPGSTHVTSARFHLPPDCVWPVIASS